MSEIEKNNRPAFATFIGYFYVFSSILILLTIFVKQDIPINVRFGLENIPNVLVVPIVAIISSVMAYGYLKMTKWGYWFTVIYSTLFMCISFTLINNVGGQPFIGNAIWSIIVLVYTILIRKKFNN